MPERELKIPRTGITLRMGFYDEVALREGSAEFVLSAAGQIVSIQINNLNQTFVFSHSEERSLCFVCKQNGMGMILGDDLQGCFLYNNAYQYHVQFYTT
jgi:hypothetical protein